MLYNQSIMVVFYLLITVHLLYGAENKNVSFDMHAIERIAMFDELRQVVHILHNRIVVNSCHGCSIIDLKTKAVSFLENDNNECARTSLVFHSGKIIADTGTKAMIYDIQTREQVYLDERIQGIIPISHTESVFLIPCSTKPNTIIQYDYKTKEAKDLIVKKKSCLMRVDPFKKVICVPSGACILFYNLNDLSKVFKAFPLRGGIRDPYFCEYSPAGRFIAVGDRQKVNIINYNKSILHALIDAKKSESFRCLKFHPDGIHLALLTHRYKGDITKGCIKFVNIETKKYVPSIKLGSDKAVDFSFSDDGLEFVAGLKDECLRGLVPFAVEKECLNLLRWLYKFEEEKKIPHDIVRYCITVFLRALSISDH